MTKTASQINHPLAEDPEGDTFVLTFEPNIAGKEIGMGNSGIETYKDSPYSSVARETGQNSADAWSAKPVKMTFDLLQVKRSEIPAFESCESAVAQCLEKAKATSSKKAIAFFTRATEVLEQDEIPVLRISDFHTKGLVGPCVEGTPFHSLVKGSGVNNKYNDTSGGSFGIGKNAAFAISELQTVFYSTIYLNKLNGKEFLTQGKSVFISHTDAEGNPVLDEGYWGQENFQPVSNKKDVPEWLRRDDVGTSVFAFGFRPAPHWQQTIAASILINFFHAVFSGEMEFSINHDAITITKGTVQDLFDDPHIAKAAAEYNMTDDFEFSKSLLACLTSTHVENKIEEIEGLGKVSVRVLSQDKLARRICIVRNGMVITDNLKNFGHPFQRFPLCKDFVALVEPLDDKGSSLIKELENPQHNSLSAKRITDEARSIAAERSMKKLALFIRNTIRDETKSKVADHVSIDELSDCFADVDNIQTLQEPAKENEENKPESAVYREVEPVKPQKYSPSAKGPAAGAGGGASQTGGPGTIITPGSTGPNSGEGSGGSGATGGEETAGPASHIIRVQLGNIRNTPVSGKDGHWRKLFFTSPLGGNLRIRIEAVGIMSNSVLGIASATNGTIEGGILSVDVTPGERTSVDVQFKQEYAGPIELPATLEVKKES